MTAPCQICARSPTTEELAGGLKGWQRLGPFRHLNYSQVLVCPECAADMGMRT